MTLFEQGKEFFITKMKEHKEKNAELKAVLQTVEKKEKMKQAIKTTRLKIRLKGEAERAKLTQKPQQSDIWGVK